jgi:hypothetical protein
MSVKNLTTINKVTVTEAGSCYQCGAEMPVRSSEWELIFTDWDGNITDGYEHCEKCVPADVKEQYYRVLAHNLRHFGVEVATTPLADLRVATRARQAQQEANARRQARREANTAHARAGQSFWANKVRDAFAHLA